MLGKVYSLLQQNNPELADRQVRCGPEPKPSSGNKSPASVWAVAPLLPRSAPCPHRRRFPCFFSPQRKKLKPPEVMRVGTTRSAWVNFRDCCAMMKRAQEHVVRVLVAGRRLASSAAARARHSPCCPPPSHQ